MSTVVGETTVIAEITERQVEAATEVMYTRVTDAAIYHNTLPVDTLAPISQHVLF